MIIESSHRIFPCFFPVKSPFARIFSLFVHLIFPENFPVTLRVTFQFFLDFPVDSRDFPMFSDIHLPIFPWSPPHSSSFLASLRDFSNISSEFPMNFPWISGFPMNFPWIFHGFRQTTHIAGLPHRWRAAGERPHGGTLAAAATRGMGPWRPWGPWGPGSWWYTVDVCGYTIQLYIYISNLI